MADRAAWLPFDENYPDLIGNTGAPGAWAFEVREDGIQGLDWFTVIDAVDEGDLLQGGAGDDLYVVADAGDAVVELAGGG